MPLISVLSTALNSDSLSVALLAHTFSQELVACMLVLHVCGCCMRVGVACVWVLHACGCCMCVGVACVWVLHVWECVLILGLTSRGTRRYPGY